MNQNNYKGYNYKIFLNISKEILHYAAFFSSVHFWTFYLDGGHMTVRWHSWVPITSTMKSTLIRGYPQYLMKHSLDQTYFNNLKYIANSISYHCLFHALIGEFITQNASGDFPVFPESLPLVGLVHGAGLEWHFAEPLQSVVHHRNRLLHQLAGWGQDFLLIFSTVITRSVTMQSHALLDSCVLRF